MSSQTIFVTKGSTDVSVDVHLIQDAGATSPGDPLTGLLFNSTGLVCYYREGGTGAVTQLTLATQTVTGAHSDGGFVELSSTLMPGSYRLDLSDTIVSGTNNQATVVLSGNADLAPHTVNIVLTDLDLYDGVRAGLTALPNAAADAAGGLPISDAGGLDLDTMNSNVTASLADTNELQTDWANGGRLDTILDARAAEATVAALNDISTADVNAQVVDVLKTDTVSEMAQGAPTATPTMEQILNYLYREYVRNRIVVDTNTANQKQIFADDGTTILYEKDLTNASNVTTVAEATTGA